MVRRFEIDRAYISRMEMAMGVNVNDYLSFSRKFSSSDDQVEYRDGEIFSYHIESQLKRPSQWLKPTFVKIHESKELTPEQAGAILEHNVVKARDYLSTRPLVKDAESETQTPEVIRNDPCERSRVPFFIVDLGYCAHPRVHDLMYFLINRSDQCLCEISMEICGWPQMWSVCQKHDASGAPRRQR